MRVVSDLDATTAALLVIERKLYGPRYCAHCKAVQPVLVIKMQGSDFTRYEHGPNESILHVGFAGARVCTVCQHTVEDTPKESP